MFRWLDNAYLVMIALASSATAMIAARRTEIWLTGKAYRHPGNRAPVAGGFWPNRGQIGERMVKREPGMVLREK